MAPTEAEHPEQESAGPESQARSRRGRDDIEHIEDRLRSLRDAIRAAGRGDFWVGVPPISGEEGVVGEVALAFNVLADRNEALARELDRVSRVVGAEGQITQRATL